MDSAFIRKLGAEIGYKGELQEMRDMSLSFSLQQKADAPAAHRTSSQIAGGRFFSEDRKFVVQMRHDGMTFSRLPPYTKWEQVFQEAKRLWLIFCAHMQPSVISRIAVRNVNRLLLPQPYFSNAPADFLNPPPAEPGGLRKESIITQWMHRFVISEVEKDVSAVVMQLSDSAVDPKGRYALIFDIDVFTMVDLSTDPESLLPRFEQLRECKNRIFFSNLTERTLDLFK
jgi:uncharacterized protein (TIGR04255 family)